MGFFVPYAKSITVMMETNKINQLDKLKIETLQPPTPAGNGLQNVNKANVIGLNLVFIYLIIELLNPIRNNVTIFDASTVFPVTFIVDFVSLIKTNMEVKTADFIYALNSIPIEWSTRQQCLKPLLNHDLSLLSFYFPEKVLNAESLKNFKDTTKKIRKFMEKEMCFCKNCGHLAHCNDSAIFVSENKDTLSGFALFARPSVKTMLGKSIAQQKRFNRTATELNDSPSNILDTDFLQNINDVTQTALEKISFIFPDWESYLVENPQSLPIVTLPSSDTRTDLGTYSIPEVPEENHDFKIQPLLSEMLSKNGDDEAIN